MAVAIVYLIGEDSLVFRQTVYKLLGWQFSWAIISTISFLAKFRSKIYFNLEPNTLKSLQNMAQSDNILLIKSEICVNDRYLCYLQYLLQFSSFIFHFSFSIFHFAFFIFWPRFVNGSRFIRQIIRHFPTSSTRPNLTGEYKSKIINANCPNLPNRKTNKPFCKK